MSNEKKLDARIRLLDAAYHNLAVEAFESDEVAQEAMREFGLDSEAAEKRLAERTRRSISMIRRSRLEDARAGRMAARAKAGVDRLKDWTREQLIERWEQLQLQFPGQLQLEHQNLERMPLEDLRSLAADFESMVDGDEH